MYTGPSSPPQNVLVTSVNSTSLMVSWQPPPVVINRSGQIRGYVIHYAKVGSVETREVNVTSGTTHTISGLDASVDYSVIVAAMDNNGTGHFSDPVIGRLGDKGELMSAISYICM